MPDHTTLPLDTSTIVTPAPPPQQTRVPSGDQSTLYTVPPSSASTL